MASSSAAGRAAPFLAASQRRLGLGALGQQGDLVLEVAEVIEAEADVTGEAASAATGSSFPQALEAADRWPRW